MEMTASSTVFASSPVENTPRLLWHKAWGQKGYAFLLVMSETDGASLVPVTELTLLFTRLRSRGSRWVSTTLLRWSEPTSREL